MPSDPNLPPTSQELGLAPPRYPAMPSDPNEGIHLQHHPHAHPHPHPHHPGLELPPPTSQEQGPAPPRYAAMQPDPTVPPQEAGIPLQHRSLHLTQTGLPPGHHIVQQIDPTNLQLAPTPQGTTGPTLQLDTQRLDGPPPAQIVVEHPGPPGGPPIHITHHRVPPPPQIHIEHPVGGGPPRQVFMEPPQTIQLEHAPPLQPPPGHPTSVQPPPPQDVYEGQQVAPAPPQFQNFEHIAASQQSHPPMPPGDQLLAPPPGSTVMVSSSQLHPQYSVAISSAGPPGPPSSFALPTSAQGFPIHSQPISQPMQQRLVESHPHMSAPPPPTASYSVALPAPTSTHHFQPQFTNQQGVPANHQLPPHLVQPTAPPPTPTPVNSQYQPQPHHTQPGIPYWVSQA